MASGPPSISLRRYFALLLMAVVVAGGSATLLGFCGRWGWLLELTCHFRVQYFWSLTLAAGGLALVRRFQWAAVGGLFAAVNLALILPLYFGLVQPAAEGPAFRAMSLNVHWLNRDFARTLDLIRNERPDFVVLIEITPEWSSALAGLEDVLPYGQTAPRNSSGGIALLSRHRITEIEVRDVSGVGLPSIVAQLDLPGGPLTVIGTHPSSPSSPMNFDFRNRQLADLGLLASRRAGAVMLIGDFNTTSWSPYFHDLLASSGLADTRRGFGVEGSWPGLPLPLRIPIDHCLVTPDIAIDNRRVGPPVGSDHRPIIVDFSIRRK
jgi:endonuclease/exonuclease/phosphatase (EEP) superfamily protein YafD